MQNFVANFNGRRNVTLYSHAASWSRRCENKTMKSSTKGLASNLRKICTTRKKVPHTAYLQLQWLRAMWVVHTWSQLQAGSK